jgi:hypothetical protein
MCLYSFLGEVENISGPAPVSDMRTVTDAPVSAVTSFRLPRTHLMHRSGSHYLFGIPRAPPCGLRFRACIPPPRGGPRREPSRAVRRTAAAQRFHAHFLSLI